MYPKDCKGCDKLAEYKSYIRYGYEYYCTYGDEYTRVPIYKINECPKKQEEENDEI